MEDEEYFITEEYRVHFPYLGKVAAEVLATVCPNLVGAWEYAAWLLVSQGPSHPDGLTLYILGPRGRAWSGTSRAATRWPLATYLQPQRRRGFESHRCRAINNLAVEVPPVSN